MNPEDVPAELVDLGYAAMLDAGYRVVEDIGDQVPEDQAVRKVLAAVMPGIQAQALREAADVVKKHTGRLESADGADEVVSLIESVIRHRAARLTETTEETNDD